MLAKLKLRARTLKPFWLLHNLLHWRSLRRNRRLYEEQGVRRSGLESVEFLARQGDMLIWHHNLLHGGRPVEREGATRRSLVAHYFADEVICYHEVTERPAILESSVPLPA